MNARKESSEIGQEATHQTVFAFDQESETETADFFLIDLAKYSIALRLLFEHEPAPVYDLPYLHNDERDSAFYGPLLIEPVGADCQEWLDTWVHQGKAVSIQANHLDLQTVRQHFVGLNRAQTPFGSSLFRYADPATYASVGQSLSPAQRLRILGPLTAIHGCYVGQNWRLSSLQPESILLDGGPEPLQLVRDNLDAVTQYRLGLLATALGDSHNLAPGLVSDWFRQLTALGAPSEQGLVESSELLIHRGLDRRLDDRETSQIRQAGDLWSEKLNAIGRMNFQEGT